ncbi:3-phosphoshikimate 1-carboxyvinyltransferase [Stomatohabitans albus]|uniref:3-phosphoshikimate 1-carboxyvinyltransferase n=1 Tax=Stomatohabitans albus TaxID=3110766 RepID=UPI00300CAD4F
MKTSEPPSTQSTLTIVPGPVSGEVAAPSSKSVTNRALLLAGLASGRSTLHNPLVSDDSAAMVSLIRALGATVHDDDPATWSIDGVAGKPMTPDHHIDCRLSGTTMRFGMAAACLAEGPVTLTGQPPLLRRPLAGLIDALQRLGATVAAQEGGFAPVRVGGGLAGGHADIDVTASSQFASAVLLAAPMADSNTTITVSGDYAEKYIDLTLSAMRDWGAYAQEIDGGWVVEAHQMYLGQEMTIEYDASAAAHLLALAVTTGGSLTITNTQPTLQGDADMADVFEAFGATIERQYPATTITGPTRPVSPGFVDLSEMPDQIATVAAIAAVAEGTTQIRGAQVARGHEVDRIWAVANEFSKLGIPVVEHPDGLDVTGVTQLTPTVVDTHHDHRMAMGLSAIGVRLAGITFVQPDCVQKTYPLFFDTLAHLQGRV